MSDMSHKRRQLDFAFSKEEAEGNSLFFKEHGYKNLQIREHRDGTFSIWGNAKSK